jgi:hypothetical protein
VITRKAPTLAEIKEWPATCSVVSAGAALGLGRNHTYELIKLGEFPLRILQIGKRYRCITSQLVALLESPETSTATAV